MPSALLIIDVQRGLFDGSPRPHDAERVIDRINRLSTKARLAKAPVFFIQHATTEGLLIHNSPGRSLEKRLATSKEDRYVRKTTCDSFLRTDLEASLKSLSLTHLVICGYATEFCIDTTVRRAGALGY